MKHDGQDATVTSTACTDFRDPQPDATTSPDLRTREPERYEVIAEHGRGGLGRVLRAHDRDLGRDVAIKEALSRGVSAEARFVREAMITARLEHPGIVPVHDAGRWPDGTPFYAMKLVSGRPLKQLVQQASTPAARLALLPHVIAVADAIAYAHDRGIVHRDLKPSNLIVGDFGETVVIDWGLAKDVRAPEDDGPAVEEPPLGDASLTRTGVVLGTPSYMPPEQARGEPVDERADVYALGAVIYHVLGGAPPYGGSHADVLSRVLTMAPEPLESVVPDVPPELAAIVRKAMARVREERYPDARMLAEDLRRFHTGRLVAAHDYSRRALILRWLRRHRVPVAVGAVALVTLVAVGIVALRGILASKREAQAERSVAVQGRREAVEHANELILIQARNNLDRDPTAAIAWLKSYPDDGKDVQDAHWIAADAVSRGVARQVLTGHHGSVVRAAILADGTAVTVASNEAIRFWNLASGTVFLELPAHVTLWANLQVSRDGRRVSYREDMHTTVVVDIGDWRPRRFQECSHRWLAAWLSGRGNRIACTDDRRPLRIVDVDTGAVTSLDALGPTEEMSALALSDDGNSVAVGFLDGSIVVASTRDGAKLELSGRGPAMPQRLDLSPDGQSLLVGNFDGSLDLWRVRDRASERLAKPGSGNRSSTLSWDGRWVAFVASDGSVEVRSTGSAARETLAVEGRSVIAMDLSRDGRLLAIAFVDGRAEVWQLGTKEHWLLRGHAAGLEVVAFSADASKIITGGVDRSARVWPVPRPIPTLLWKDPYGRFTIAHSADGRSIVSDGVDGYLHVYDRGTGQVRRVPTQPVSVLLSVAVSADHLQVVGGAADGTVRIFTEPFEGPERVLKVGMAEILRVACSPTARYFAGAGPDGLRIWRNEAPDFPVVFASNDWTLSAQFAPKGDLAAVGLRDGRILVVDPATNQVRALEGHDDGVTALSFSRDGRRLASGSWDKTVRIWDLETGTVRLLSGALERILDVALSPDGRRVAAAGEDGDLCVWDLNTGTSQHLRGHTRSVRRLAFSGDGRFLVSVSWDGTGRVWALADGSASVLHVGDPEHESEIEALTILPDGDSVVIGDADGYVRSWHLKELKFPPSGTREFRRWLDAQSSATIKVH